MATDTSFYLSAVPAAGRGSQILIRAAGRPGHCRQSLRVDSYGGPDVSSLDRAAGDRLGAARWSPDGSRSSTAPRRPTTARPSVFIVNANGTGPSGHRCPGHLVRHRPDLVAGRHAHRVHALRARDHHGVRPTGIYSIATASVRRPSRSPGSPGTAPRPATGTCRRRGLLPRVVAGRHVLLALPSEATAPGAHRSADGTWHALDRISPTGSPAQSLAAPGTLSRSVERARRQLPAGPLSCVEAGGLDLLELALDGLLALGLRVGSPPRVRPRLGGLLASGAVPLSEKPSDAAAAW